MPESCMAYKCHNRRGQKSGRKFHRLPWDPDRRAKWIAAISRADPNNKNKAWVPTGKNDHWRLCSDHFISGKKGNDPTSPDYAPSIFAHTSTPLKRKRKREMETYTRREQSKKQRRDQCAKAPAASALLKLSEQVISTTLAPDSVNVMGDDQDNPATMTADECQNTECIELKQSFEQLSSSFDKLKAHSEMLETDCQALRNENSILKDKIKSLSLLEADFKDDDDKVKMLTGVQSFTALMTLFYIIQDHLKANSALSPFKQFILTLLRLRLNLSFTFLAYYFGVHVMTVSQIFHHCINLMYTRLAPSLVFWPDREELR
ncbi:THAP domain-containing protein 1 A-like [Neoarius graeffei]|uniref:THAP domain-containing protein 1 A-like n=1 Tax=Neoarius graeffei TaxID=443677 RepID=UPI00298BE996|nr:THAP domain-containing protein 1 A-like [Neoarius graeffei]